MSKSAIAIILVVLSATIPTLASPGKDRMFTVDTNANTCLDANPLTQCVFRHIISSMKLKQFGPYSSSKYDTKDMKKIRIDFFADNNFYVIVLSTFDKNGWQQGYSVMDKAEAGCSGTFAIGPFQQSYQKSNTLSSIALVYLKQPDGKFRTPTPIDISSCK